MCLVFNSPWPLHLALLAPFHFTPDGLRVAREKEREMMGGKKGRGGRAEKRRRKIKKMAGGPRVR